MTILTIARTTFGEAIRRKVLVTFLAVTVALIPISLMFGFFSYRQELTTIKSFYFGMIGIAGLLIALIMGIQLVPIEIERRTIYTIHSKPVNRYEFLLGKFLGALSTLLLSIALMGVAAIIAVTMKTYGDELSRALIPITEPFSNQKLHISEIGRGIAAIFAGLVPTFRQLAPGVVLIYFQLTMVVGLAMFFSTCLGAWVNFFTTSALYCVGSLSQVTDSLIRGENKSLLTKGFAYIIHYLVPQFGNFHVLNPILQPHNVVRDLDKYIAQNVVYAMLVCVMLMAFGIWIFEKKEV
ncbi:MAG: ABC transporter permease subunit [Armatimonadota bacterium]|nr:ABC transporter permease subunit [Armatimonadota bacterium]